MVTNDIEAGDFRPNPATGRKDGKSHHGSQGNGFQYCGDRRRSDHVLGCAYPEQWLSYLDGWSHFHCRRSSGTCCLRLGLCHVRSSERPTSSHLRSRSHRYEGPDLCSARRSALTTSKTATLPAASFPDAAALWRELVRCTATHCSLVAIHGRQFGPRFERT